jgi:hypothetical protein
VGCLALPTSQQSVEKKPFNPVNGRATKTNARRTWGTFSQALYRLETGKYHGIGFVFSDEDPFTGPNRHQPKPSKQKASWNGENEILICSFYPFAGGF